MADSFEQLCEARDSGALVRLHCICLWDDKVPGRVVCVNELLVLLEAVDSGVRFDGFIAIRMDDIWKVDVPGKWHQFSQAALDARGITPTDVEVPMTSLSDLIRSAQASFPIMRFSAPAVYGETNAYGHVLAIDNDHVRFRPITMDGVWSECDQILALDVLMRIDFGGDIETMLSSLTLDLGI